MRWALVPITAWRRPGNKSSSKTYNDQTDGLIVCQSVWMSQHAKAVSTLVPRSRVPHICDTKNQTKSIGQHCFGFRPFACPAPAVIGTNIGVLLIEVLVKVGSFGLCGNSKLSCCTFFKRMRWIARLEMRPTTVGHHVRHSITISFRYLWLMCSAILHNISGNSGGLRPASYSTRVFIFTFIMQLLTLINTLVLICHCVCWRIKIPQSKFTLHASYTIRHKMRHNDNPLVLIFTPATSRMRCICCLWLTPWPKTRWPTIPRWYIQTPFNEYECF